jgi:hypothetical protein
MTDITRDLYRQMERKVMLSELRNVVRRRQEDKSSSYLSITRDPEHEGWWCDEQMSVENICSMMRDEYFRSQRVREAWEQAGVDVRPARKRGR